MIVKKQRVELKRDGSFLLTPTPPPPIFFWKIRVYLITNRLEYKPEGFSFKFILRVIVQDSDTNFVRT